MKINCLIDCGFAINIINLATFQNLKKVNSKLHLKTTKTKIVPNEHSKNCLKIEGLSYFTLETSSEFAADKFYVVNTKAKNLLAGSWAIALNLLSLNAETSKSYQKQKHQSKHQLIRTSSIKNIRNICKCENNLTIYDIKYKNLCNYLNLADFKTQQENNIPKRLRKLAQTYRESLFTEKIRKLKDTKSNYI